MNCNEMLLEDYVEGFLTANETAKLEAHIATCIECQQTLEQLRAEQQLLAGVFNEVTTTSHVSKNVMQQIQQKRTKKAYWQRYKIALIVAAIMAITFTLVSTMNEPLEEEKTMPSDRGTIASELPTDEENQTYDDIPINGQPILTIEVDHIQEIDGMIDITYRSNYNEQVKKYSDESLENLAKTYQLDKKEFSLGWLTLISAIIRNENSEAVTAFDVLHDENLMYQPVNMTKTQTEKDGEMIVNFLLPVEANPSTLEISSFYVQLYTFSDPTIVFKNESTTFNYFNEQFTIDRMRIENNQVKMTIPIEGQPAIIPHGFLIQVNEAYYHNIVYREIIDNEIKLNIIVPELKEVPDKMTIIPIRGLIEQTLEQPIILDLKEAEEPLNSYNRPKQ